MDYSNFITTEELHDRLDEFLLIDVQFVLGDSEASERCYTKGHINGAIHLNLETEVSGEISKRTGRHPLPQLEQFISTLERKGISPDRKIAIYDNFSGGAAARVWWMLKTLGFPDVFVVAGGIDRWREMYEITTDIQIPAPVKLDRSSFPESWDSGEFPIVSDKDILNGNFVLVDSRNRERYLLQESGPDPVIGRIPNALNLPWGENVGDDGLPLGKTELLERFSHLRGKPIVFYCGSGVSACFNILLAHELGLGIQTLYPGSYSEWYKRHPEKLT